MARIANSTKKPTLRLIKNESLPPEKPQAPKSAFAKQMFDFCEDLDTTIELIKSS